MYIYLIVFKIQDCKKSTLKEYWKNLCAVAMGCVSLFIFDMCERGVQLHNPFYSIWVTDIGTNLAVSFHIKDYVNSLFLFRFVIIIFEKFCTMFL